MGRAGDAMEIAVIGAGVAGLGAAYMLGQRHRVTLYERNSYLGGHSNTVDVDVDGRRVPVDTGFIVYNERNYPNLTRLFGHLAVPTEPSEMSFAVSIAGDDGRAPLEYGGGSLGQLFAQKRNLASPRFLGMIADVLRFFSHARGLIENEAGADADMSLGAFLADGRYGDMFVYDHLLPMAAAIWSCPLQTMLAFPARSFARFFHNHGLLNLTDRPRWRTVSGGSREYVRRLAAALDARPGQAATAVLRDETGAIVHDNRGGSRRFDQIVIATHADEALTLLDRPSPEEAGLLGAFRYQRNRAVLHSDDRLMPGDRRIWSSWNYMAAGARDAERRVAVTYWMNLLQNIDRAKPLFVSLNPIVEPRPERVYAGFDYDHPIFDAGAIGAQKRLGTIQGRNRVWFCGSYCGYGFHEDALSAAISVARALGAAAPWEVRAANVNAASALAPAADD